MFLVAAMLASTPVAWQYLERKDQFSDAVAHSAAVTSESKQLAIIYSCGNGRPAITFSATRRFGGRYSAGLKRTPFDLRAGTRPAIKYEILSKDAVAPAYQGLGGSYAMIETELLSGEAKLIVRAEMLSGDYPTESFDMRGAREAIGKAKAACGIS